MAAIHDRIAELAALAPTVLPEDGAVLESNFNKIVNSITKLRELGSLLLEWNLPPIGGKYWRYPGATLPGPILLPADPEPDDLWPDTTWEEISSYYAGVFFRVDGGAALAFNAGKQGFALQWHRHDGNFVSSLAGGVAGGTGGPFGVGGLSGLGDPSNSPSHDAVQVAQETRPVNLTIKVYRRLA